MKASLDGVGSLLIPEVAVSAAQAGSWVAEGSPAPVKALAITQTTLGPARKLMCIGVFSREVMNASATTVEAITRQVMREAAGLALDAALFDNAAASSSRPAGLLNGLTALTVSPEIGADAMNADLAALAAAVAPAGTDVLFIASPAQAAAISLQYGSDASKSLAASSALAPGTVIALAVNAFVSAFGSDPEFDMSDTTTLHMENAAPAAIGTAGTPSVVAAPVLSLWQNGLVGLKMRLRAAWTKRSANTVAFMEGVSW